MRPVLSDKSAVERGSTRTRRKQGQADNTAEATVSKTTANTGNTTVELKIEQTQWLQRISFDSQCFQKLIQLVIFETEELADIGELPEGFKKVSKAWVIKEEEEDALVTEVHYERKDRPVW